MIEIDPSAVISPLADVEDSTRGTRIVFGARTRVDAFVKIKPAGGSGDVIVGPDCTINSGCVLYTGHGIRMGSGVLVAANCTFAPTNHATARRDVPIREQGFMPSRGGIVVGDDVWIGANCVILDGAVIEDGCVVGAGAIVRGRLAAYGIYAGAPLRRIGERQ